jgi:low affinity Fe/Cu permease
LKKQNIYKKSIRVELTLFMCLTAMIVIITAITLGYLGVFTLLRNTIVEDHKKIALILSDRISQMISDETNEIHTYLSRNLIKDTINKSNEQYEGMEQDAIHGYLMDMDNKWIEASDDSLLVKEYAENFASLSLKERVKRKKIYVKCF